MNNTLLLFLFLLVVVVASVVTGLGSMVYFALGKKGSEAVFEKHPRLDRKRWDQVQAWYERYGTAVLLLTTVPFVSSVIMMGAGAFGIPERRVLVWAIAGRFIRYVLYLLLVLVLYFVIRFFM